MIFNNFSCHKFVDLMSFGACAPNRSLTRSLFTHLFVGFWGVWPNFGLEIVPVWPSDPQPGAELLGRHSDLGNLRRTKGLVGSRLAILDRPGRHLDRHQGHIRCNSVVIRNDKHRDLRWRIKWEGLGFWEFSLHIFFRKFMWNINHSRYNGDFYTYDWTV